jgi:hypothetical protein
LPSWPKNKLDRIFSATCFAFSSCTCLRT